MTADDFEAWQENPVTQYVMKALSVVAEEAKSDWQVGAWGGNLRPEYLAETRGRYSAYATILNMTFEGVQFVNGDSTEDADETE